MGRCLSVRPSGRPSIRLLTILFSISSLITWPTELKFCIVILDIGAQSRLVPDFVISSEWASFEIFNFYLLLYYVAD